MTASGGNSKLKWAFIFFCEAALIITLIILIVLFSVPTERKLMDTVLELYHAKEVKYSQYENRMNVYSLMNLDERRKGNGDMKDDLLDNVEMRFMYHDGSAVEQWNLTIMSLHFSSHNQAREYFNSFSTADPDGQRDRATTDWYEYSDSRVKELATNGFPVNQDGKSFPVASNYECYIMYLEGKSVVLIRFFMAPGIDEEREKKLSDLCYELSLPNPLELENSRALNQQEEARPSSF